MMQDNPKPRRRSPSIVHAHLHSHKPIMLRAHARGPAAAGRTLRCARAELPAGRRAVEPPWTTGFIRRTTPAAQWWLTPSTAPFPLPAALRQSLSMSVTNGAAAPPAFAALLRHGRAQGKSRRGRTAVNTPCHRPAPVRTRGRTAQMRQLSSQWPLFSCFTSCHRSCARWRGTGRDAPERGEPSAPCGHSWWPCGP